MGKYDVVFSLDVSKIINFNDSIAYFFSKVSCNGKSICAVRATANRKWKCKPPEQNAFSDF